MTNILESLFLRAPQLQSPPSTIYSFAVIIEPVADSRKERQCLTACFNESPFPFEIDKWAQALAGNDYRVADSFFILDLPTRALMENGLI